MSADDPNDVTLLPAVEDKYGGVMTEMSHPMDPCLFSTLLRTSLSNWTLQTITQLMMMSTRRSLRKMLLCSSCPHMEMVSLRIMQRDSTNGSLREMIEENGSRT